MTDGPEPRGRKARDQQEPSSPRRTVVGGRPSERGNGSTRLPQGIQLLLAAGSQDEAFRQCLLEDPLLAARRAGIPLADTESSILRAVPRAQLAAMIEGMAVSNPQRRRFLHSAATAALTLFAGTALAACSEPPDKPEPEEPLPETVLTSPGAALAEARRVDQPLMVLIRPGRPPGFPQMMAGVVNMDREKREEVAEAVCAQLGSEVYDCADHFGVLLFEHDVDLTRTLPYNATDDPFARAHEVTELPTALFLAPDGEELSRLVYPASTVQLLEAIESAAAAYATRED